MQRFFCLAEAFQSYIFFPVDIFHVRPDEFSAFCLDCRVQAPDIRIGLFHVFVADFPVDSLAKTECLDFSVYADRPTP